MLKSARGIGLTAEQVVELLRDSSDWNPILKSAAGGVANVVQHLRLTDDNKATCNELLRRIMYILIKLKELEQTSLDMEERVQCFERCLKRVTEKLLIIHHRGRLQKHAHAKSDKADLAGCRAEIDAAVNDMKLYAVLAHETHSAERHSDILHRFNASDADILSRIDASIAVAQAHKLETQQLRADVLSQRAGQPETWLQLGPPGHQLILERFPGSGRIRLEADPSMSIVLFA